MAKILPVLVLLGIAAVPRIGWAESASAPEGQSRVQAGKIDLGTHHSCVVLADGAVNCWGRNNFGMLGRGNTASIGDNETPDSVGTLNLGAGVTATATAVGSIHSCILTSGGSVKCWGTGTLGRLGYGNTTTIGDNETPDSIGVVNLGVGVTATAISAGSTHTCALLSGGTVKCWGANSYGQLGYGNT
ncbi:MAG: RCC1 domain-containing protein, partial [Actinomycetota bacterium]